MYNMYYFVHNINNSMGNDHFFLTKVSPKKQKILEKSLFSKFRRFRTGEKADRSLTSSEPRVVQGGRTIKKSVKLDFSILFLKKNKSVKSNINGNLTASPNHLPNKFFVSA